MKAPELEHTQLPEDHVRGIALRPSRGDLVPPPQKVPHAIVDVVIHLSRRARKSRFSSRGIMLPCGASMASLLAGGFRDGKRFLSPVLPATRACGGNMRKPYKRIVTFAGVLLLLLTNGAKGNSQMAFPFVEPQDGRAPIIGAFNLATQSIDLYIFRLTLPSNDPIVDSLRAATGRGVAVRALLEPCAGEEGELCTPPNVDARAACELLTVGGALVKWANPAFMKTHAKTALIDNAISLIMTLNLVPQTFTVRRDYGVLTDDPGVAENLSRVFAQDWFDGDPILDCSLTPARVPDGSPDLYASLIISPDNGRDQLIGTPEAPGLILSAQAPGSLKVQMEKIDPQNARGILPAIVDRIRNGVQVQVLLKPPTPAEPDNGVVAQEIIREGGQARCQENLHAKMMLVDTLDGPRAFIGSQNLTRSSLDRRREAGWVTADIQTRALLEQSFNSDWTPALSCVP